MEYQSTQIGSSPGTGGHIAIVPGYCGGKPHIAGHRIKVQHIAIWHEKAGLSPDEIVAEHPDLTLADVHAALAYYYDHRHEIDADIKTDDALVAELKSASRSLLLRRLS